MDASEIVKRFSFHLATEVTGPQHYVIRARCMELAYSLNDLLPDSREKSEAFTHLEDVMMWSNACIARN